MHGSQPCAGQHGLKRFRNHRHVNDDAIPFRHSFRGQSPGQSRDAPEEFGERDRPLCSRDGAVIDYCRVVTAANLNVPVQCVPAGIDERVVEPCEKRLIFVEQCFGRRFDPINRTGCLQPECFRVLLPILIGFSITHGVVHRRPDQARIQNWGDCLRRNFIIRMSSTSRCQKCAFNRNDAAGAA